MRSRSAWHASGGGRARCVAASRALSGVTFAYLRVTSAHSSMNYGRRRVRGESEWRAVSIGMGSASGAARSGHSRR
eukprot:5510668-Prymnesium_polylepis.1